MQMGIFLVVWDWPQQITMFPGDGGASPTLPVITINNSRKTTYKWYLGGLSLHEILFFFVTSLFLLPPKMQSRNSPPVRPFMKDLTVEYDSLEGPPDDIHKSDCPEP